MLNYPFPSPPVYYSNYKFDLNLNIINKVLFQTVFIGYKTDKVLNFICYGIIFPISTVLTTFIAYKCLRVAFMKHVQRFETTFVCFAYIQAAFMMWISTSFSFFYWTWGAVEYEEDYGTSKFVCVFYLYVFIYLPNFCVNLIHCTISFLLIAYYRKTHEHCCGLRLNKFNIRTAYVVIMNLAFCDVLFFFCISWIAMAKADEERNYQTKCFVLLNPLFQRFKIVNLIKGLEWQTQIFAHTVPCFFTIAYMMFALYKMFTNHMLRRRGEGIQIREKQHHGGSVTTLAFSTIFMILEMFFYLFCDIYEISLHYSLGPTNADFFFSLKNGKTIMRTIFALLSPFQLLALSSFNPDFQSTMLRYLNGTYEFNVLTQKTIGGDTKITVIYDPLPEPSKLTWLAWLYYKWCRCYFFVCIFRRFLDLVEDSARNRRQRQRQRRLNRAIAREKKANAKKTANVAAPSRPESRIQIDEDEPTEIVSLVPASSPFHVVESTV